MILLGIKMKSVYLQVQKYYSELSSTEQLVIDFVLEYKDIEHLKLNVIQSALHISSSTIIRAIKKMDYESFTEFKYALIHTRAHGENEWKNKDYEALIQTITNDFNRTIEMMDKEKIIKCADIILTSRRIFCVGMGSSMNVIDSLNRSLKNLGLWSNDYTEASPFREVPDIAKKEDCLLVVSLKGEEQQILDIVALCKAKGVNIISITAFPANSLSNLSNNVLFVNQSIQDRKRLRSRLMLSVAADILFETILIQKKLH